MESDENVSLASSSFDIMSRSPPHISLSPRHDHRSNVKSSTMFSRFEIETDDILSIVSESVHHIAVNPHPHVSTVVDIIFFPGLGSSLDFYEEFLSKLHVSLKHKDRSKKEVNLHALGQTNHQLNINTNGNLSYDSSPPENIRSNGLEFLINQNLKFLHDVIITSHIRDKLSKLSDKIQRNMADDNFTDISITSSSRSTLTSLTSLSSLRSLSISSRSPTKRRDDPTPSLVTANGESFIQNSNINSSAITLITPHHKRKLILIGHGIGCYVLMEVLRRDPIILSQVSDVIFLSPFILWKNISLSFKLFVSSYKFLRYFSKSLAHSLFMKSENEIDRIVFEMLENNYNDLSTISSYDSKCISLLSRLDQLSHIDMCFVYEKHDRWSPKEDIEIIRSTCPKNSYNIYTTEKLSLSGRECDETLQFLKNYFHAS